MNKKCKYIIRTIEETYYSPYLCFTLNFYKTRNSFFLILRLWIFPVLLSSCWITKNDDNSEAYFLKPALPWSEVTHFSSFSKHLNIMLYMSNFLLSDCVTCVVCSGEIITAFILKRESVNFQPFVPLECRTVVEQFMILMWF